MEVERSGTSQHGEQDRGRDRTAPEQEPGTAGAPCSEPRIGGKDRQQCPEHRFESLRIGSHVGPFRRLRRVEKRQKHRRDPDDRDSNPRQDSHRIPVLGPENPQHQPGDSGDEQRPDNVELFLDGEAPHVQQGRDSAVILEIRGRAYESPVRKVEDRVPGIKGEIVAAMHQRKIPRPDEDDAHHQQGGGHESFDPPTPEIAQGYPSAAFDLRYQSRGNEETGEHEEHVHAQKPGRHVGGRDVEENHQPYRYGPQTIKRVEPVAVTCGGLGQ